jgi:hypothetical protein
MSRRAIRRHHYRRLKNNRKYYSTVNYPKAGRETLEVRSAIAATTATRCSCTACGNPRNSAWSSGDSIYTRQELKADLIFKEQLEEL